jgi:hypothetical protein
MKHKDNITLGMIFKAAGIFPAAAPADKPAGGKLFLPPVDNMNNKYRTTAAGIFISTKPWPVTAGN